ncbi:MAG: isocitrate/isopropylmalate dehydrogenase family protein [Candidatus Dormibacteria bacterium]
MRTLRVAVIPGDGVGPEISEACQPVIEAAAAGAGVLMESTQLDWGGERHLRLGSPMPEDGPSTLRRFDAALFGAVGRPDVPDHELIWGLIIRLRQELGLSVNLRPALTFPGVCGPLRGGAAIDLLVVRENTEGEYAGAGGRLRSGHPGEVAVEVAIHSRSAITDAARFAFEAARRRRNRLHLVTKSNAMRYGYVLWDEVVAEVAVDYPDVSWERVLVDAMAARVVQHPEELDVLLCSNLFGDILSDLTAALVGGLGMAPSANIRPGQRLGIFEPVHGSAPDIAGRGIANPAGYLLSAAMMFDHLELGPAGDRIRSALADVLQQRELRTPDLGGTATTTQLASAVLARVRAGEASPP